MTEKKTKNKQNVDFLMVRNNKVKRKAKNSKKLLVALVII